MYRDGDFFGSVSLRRTLTALVSGPAMEFILGGLKHRETPGQKFRVYFLRFSDFWEAQAGDLCLAAPPYWTAGVQPRQLYPWAHNVQASPTLGQHPLTLAAP